MIVQMIVLTLLAMGLGVLLFGIAREVYVSWPGGTDSDEEARRKDTEIV